MAQQHTAAPAIRLEDLQCTLWSAKLRKQTQGRTALLAATTQAPALPVDCRATPGLRAAAQKCTAVRICAPMQRGHMATVIKRVATEYGAKEVRATWGAGVRALKAEPRYVLNGGVQA